MVPQLHPQFDFAISESCAAFGEGPLGDCAAYAQPRFQGKPIWDIEYCDAGVSETGSVAGQGGAGQAGAAA